MNQILHIFRKDTRHFWPEILASLVIVFASAILYPFHWDTHTRPDALLTTLTAATMFLVPLSWWLLAARVTHAETLVGDQQFWITRPYEWKKLLAAKALFFAIWIVLPFLLAQSLLLIEAGFNPLHSIPGLLLTAFLVGTVISVPLFSIAAVTTNFARMTLTLLGIILIVYISAIIFSQHQGYTASNPYHNVLFAPVFFCGCAIAIVLQYATRKTWRSRILLAVLPVLLVAIGFAYNRQSLVDRAYPAPGAGSVPVVQGMLGVDSRHLVETHINGDYRFVDIPMHFSGIAAGYAVVAENYKFTLTAVDGSQWTSPWQSSGSEYFPNLMLPPEDHQALSLRLDPAQFQRFSTAPVTVHITYAVTLLRADSPIQTTFPASETSLPGLGRCTPKSGWSRSTRGEPDLFCKTPFYPPEVTYLTAQWSDIPCSAPASSSEPPVQGNAWLGMVDPYLDINRAPISVATSVVRFSHTSEGLHICSGSPLTLTPYQVVGRTRFEVTIPNFQIPAIKFRN